jgi:hypothetical protein
MSSPSSPEPPSPIPADHRRQHDLRGTVTTLRLRTQLLHRLAQRQGGPTWQRMTDGLLAIDADLSTLLRHLDHHDSD